VWNVPEPIYIAGEARPVFLSYAREDTAVLDELASALIEEGMSVWIDRSNVRSGDWKQRVTEGLGRSRAVVMLLTQNALASDSVKKELDFAMKKRVPVIPVQLGEMAEEQLPDWFRFGYDDLHRHILEQNRYKDGVKELASAIRHLRPHSKAVYQETTQSATE
jgi:hypothetical protein